MKPYDDPWDAAEAGANESSDEVMCMCYCCAHDGPPDAPAPQSLDVRANLRAIRAEAMKRRNGEPTLLQWMGFDLIGLLDIAIAALTPQPLNEHRLGIALRTALEQYPLTSHTPELIAIGQAYEYARLSRLPSETGDE